jgi:lipopolysaccharide transport system permease protein
MDKWDIEISPKRSWFHLNLKEIWRYRDLFVLFVRRDIVAVYKQTVLGPLWFFIQPLLTTIIYTFVFGKLAAIPTDGLPQPLFYMSGIVLWNYFAQALNATASTFVSNAGLFSKVYFPRIISPLSQVTSSMLTFFIQLAMLAILWSYYYYQGAIIAIQWQFVLFPILLAMMALLGLGIGLILSSMTTKYRDLRQLITFGVSLLMYATPVIYPLSEVPEKYAWIIEWNPTSHIIEGFRYMLLGAGNFSGPMLAYSGAVSLILFLIGLMVFNKTEKNFLDTV